MEWQMDVFVAHICFEFSWTFRKTNKMFTHKMFLSMIVYAVFAGLGYNITLLLIASWQVLQCKLLMDSLDSLLCFFWVLVQRGLKEKSFIFQEFLYPDARDRQFLLFFHKFSKRKIFDIKRYNEIKDAISKIEGDLQVLRSPLFLHLPENARTKLLENVADKHDEKKLQWNELMSELTRVFMNKLSREMKGY